MLGLAVAFALLSSFLNGVSAVLQRRATGQIEPRDLFHHRILKAAVKHKLWLAGVGLQVAGFFAQAAALHNGSLVVVAPLLTTDLIFLLFLLQVGLHLHIGRREWAAMLALCGGLAGLLLSTRPRGGVPIVTFGHWAVAFLAIAGLIAFGALAMRRLPTVNMRAVVGGATAGLHFAFTAVATKLVLAQLEHGFGHLFVNWQLYALIIIGVTSALSMQSMYGSGPLAITQPAMEIVEAAAGIAFGLLLFGDHVHHGNGALAAEAASGLALIAGIILLAGSKRLYGARISEKS